MDKNTITGTVLIGLFILGFYWFTQPSAEQREQMMRYHDSIRQVYEETQRMEQELFNEQIQQEEARQYIYEVHDTVRNQILSQKYGRYAHAAIAEETFSVLENEVLSLTFSNKGGKLYSAELLDYKTYSQDPLILLGEHTEFGLLLSEIGMSTNELYFTRHTEDAYGKKVPKNSVVYRLYADSESYIEFAYTLEETSYRLDFDITMHGMSSYIRDVSHSLFWETTIKSLERTKAGEDLYTNIVYKYFEDEVDKTSPRASSVETKNLSGRVSWVAFKQHFFSVALIANSSFGRGGELVSEPIVDDESQLKKFSAQLYIDRDRTAQTETNSFSFFIGPNHYKILKEQNLQLESLLELGWFGFITRFVIIPIFHWLQSFIGSYGLIILLLTIIIKLMLFPLTFKSYLSTARMRVLKPQIDELNKKFPDKADAMKRQQSTMELYRKAGVNPLGGCLPMLIQFPILIAMFRFFPASIELRQQSFLWADDLSSFDAIVQWSAQIPLISGIYGNHISLFTLLMAASMIFVQKINSVNMTTTPGMPNMNVIMWMMSIMMIFWFNSYSSGLSYYYFLANIITIGQTLIIRQIIDDTAILKKLEANKKKPKKKSGFQERLEKMAREQKKLQQGRK